MRARQRRPLWGLALLAAVAACSNSTGPQAYPADPAGLSSDLQTLSGVLESPTFQSFSKVSDTTTGSPVAAPSRIGTLLRAAPIMPPRTSSTLDLNAAVRLLALRRSAATFSGGINASVVPAPLLGKTFVWDVTTHAYVEDPSATPAADPNGVRMILYAVDPNTGDIGENPLTSVGFVDLVDESTTAPAVDKLHVIVKDGTPATPGPITFVLAPDPESVTINLVFNVNDVPWARISGTDNRIAVLHNDGSQLSAAEGQAFLDLFALPGAIEFVTQSLFGPCQSLMGA